MLRLLAVHLEQRRGGLVGGFEPAEEQLAVDDVDRRLPAEVIGLEPLVERVEEGLLGGFIQAVGQLFLALDAQPRAGLGLGLVVVQLDGDLRVGGAELLAQAAEPRARRAARGDKVQPTDVIEIAAAPIATHPATIPKTAWLLAARYLTPRW